MTGNTLLIRSADTAQLGVQTTRSAKAEKDIVGMFASLMTTDGGTIASQTSQTTAADSVKGSDAAETYQYEYKEPSIEPATDTKVADAMEQSSDELEQFEEETVQTVAEELGVSEEDVTQAMETLGLTAYDLLDTENLAQLAMQLTGETSPMELLTSDTFQTLMQDVAALGTQLAETLDLTQPQMQELVAQMDVLETPQPLEEVDLQMNVQPEMSETPEMPEMAGEQATEMQPQQPEEAQPLVQNAQPQEAQREPQPEPEAKAEAPVEDTPETPQSDVESENGEEAGAQEEQTPQSAEEAVPTDRTAGERTERTTEQPLAAAQQQTAAQTVTTEAPVMETPSYVSMDTADLMEQVIEQVRTNISEGTSTMEFQLNPENLGRVYVNITSEKGVIHAQLAASNEAVRAALETQVAQLRENLNQAGVKVDAVEVTVASHEFERNLEQNQESAKQEGERQQEQASRRRNLSITGLDELSGLMTEEEALAAQIMRDNGNSVDLTA